MKAFNQLLMFVLFTSLITACGPKIYQVKNAPQLAGKHKTIAIIPPKVSIAANKKISAEAMIEQQKTESVNFQNEIYSWMLKRKMQGKFKQEIQDIITTNAKLKKAGYPETPMTSAEICSALGVDGLITSNFSLSKPMSEGGTIAMAIVFGWGATTNEVGTTVTIQDCSRNEMIWNYEHKYSGSIGSSPSRLVDALMQNASKKMPYYQK